MATKYGVKFFFGKEMGWMWLTETVDGNQVPVPFDSEFDADTFVAKMHFENNKYSYDVVEIPNDF